jgi:hypothetical protein
MEARLVENKLFRIILVASCLGIVWTVLLVFSCYRHITLEKDKLQSLARREAVTTFNKDQAVRLWSSEHGGVYVCVSEKTKPNPYLKHIEERDVTTKSGRTLTLMNPAYMIRQIMGDYEKKYGTKGHITSLKPINPINEPDAWERKTLLLFENRKTEEVMEFTREGDATFLRLMKPMVTVKRSEEHTRTPVTV